VFDGKQSIQVGFPAGVRIGRALPNFQSPMFI